LAAPQIATDAFGNALGSSLADAVQPQGASAYDYRNGSDIESNNAMAARTAVSSVGDTGMWPSRSSTADGLRLSVEAANAWSNKVDSGIAESASW